MLTLGEVAVQLAPRLLVVLDDLDLSAIAFLIHGFDAQYFCRCLEADLVSQFDRDDRVMPGGAEFFRNIQRKNFLLHLKQLEILGVSCTRESDPQGLTFEVFGADQRRREMIHPILRLG